MAAYDGAGEVLAATDGGAVCCDGSTGDADRATTDVSLAAASCFHHANREGHPDTDWQPTSAVIQSATNKAP